MRRRTRARRLGLGVALFALAGAMSGCDAATVQSILDDHADTATTGEVNSADNGASIPLGGGKTLLMFNDAYLGPLEPDRERPLNSKLVNNAVVVWNSNGNTTNTYIGPGETAQFKPADPANFYWLTNGVKDGSTIRFLAQERVKPVPPRRDFPLVANVVISVPVSNLDATPSVARLPIGSHGATWGEGILSWNGDWYVYGAVQDGLAHRTLLARAPQASLASLSSWRYYQPSAGTWSMSQDAAGALLSSSGSHVPHMLHPTVNGSEIVSLASSSVFDRAFRWASSATPWGVVTVGGNAYAPPESGQACGSGGTRIVYSVHPHDQSDPAESLWSYSTTCWAPTPGTSPGRYAPDYRPRMINLDLADAPTPCPELGEATTRSFVRASYEDMPRRTPARAEADYWTTEIAAKGHCRSRMIAQLARDGDYVGNLVDEAYQITLSRAPARAARDSRAGRIIDGTDTSTDLYASLLSSGEFFANAGSTDRGFVTALYLRLLGATPSAGDLSFWVGRTGAVGREVVAREIYQSPDSRTRRANALAEAYLGRRFTAGRELDYWRARLGEASNNDVTVTRDLVNTAEYLSRAEVRFPLA
ncbi:DUF4214 domain-containing protein [Conexibacter woesei]|uniref:Uncharacterized protein n=1 Tax=Conexibacter woesei (strain DSM 14684 / CCUG 47730 / CIP 108061 / JCM 11494 / NBRC 100937 / ID131577) TaxID=469383 RepID=D3FCX6_CONWI|nr:DUF4214 domain-containing protein [Conexibacter woesei]ADB51488.1 hypothetical protein Cwoe_3069 [Conexibacter woesei DSM 14684]